MKTLENGKNHSGFGVLELLIVVLVVAIIGVAALPRILSSRRDFRLPETQKQIVSALREARQEAVTQKKQITFYYDDTNKKIIIGGGSFGALGDIGNKVISVTGDGLSPKNIAYGEPPASISKTLSDGSTFASLTNDKLAIIFQSDGSAADENENVQDQALVFYNPRSPEESAFAVSILGAGGRVKVWQYSKQEKSFVE